MRSKLFVPGSRSELFDKAMASAADAISFDLEDAVTEDNKAAARASLRTYLSAAAKGSKTVIVRINAVDSPHYAADLQAMAGYVDVINIPKVESASQVQRVANDLEAVLPGAGPLLLLNVESPRGLRLAAEIAGAHPKVMGLQIGYADLLEPLGIDRRDVRTIHRIQLDVRLAAGEAGIAAIDAAFPFIKDAQGYEAEARMAKSLGFIGKSCIHPTQIALANEVFVPSEDEIVTAERVLSAVAEAKAAGLGVVQLDGKMIDPPFYLGAVAVMERAKGAGLR